MPIVVLLLMAIAQAIIWSLPETLYDRGMRGIFTFITFVAGGIALGIWFFLLSGVPARTRLILFGLLVLVATAATASVRRIEFTGDMKPIFDFRWSVDRDARLEEFHAQQDAAPAPLDAPPELTAWDVPEYRGLARDGVSPGPALADDWNSTPPKLRWKQPVGGGYAAFVVVGPLAITIEQRRGNEATVAYDIATGREHWVYQHEALFSEKLGGDGPRATPTYYRGRVYSLGATGHLACLDAANGKPLWSHEILADNQVQNLDWGMSGSPLCFDDLVVVNPGDQQGTLESRAVVAYDANTGQERWAGGKAKASYASPMLVTLAGVRQVLIFDGVGLAAFSPEDGGELWRHPWKSDFDINAAQPIVLDDDRLFVSSQAGCAVLRVTHADAAPQEGWGVTEVWRNRNMKCSYSCPIAHQGVVYGLDEGILACVDLADGSRHWKKGRYGHGQMLLRGDRLVILAENGELALVAADPQSYRELGKLPAIEGRTWNNPTLVDQVILVRNHLEMAAFELPLAGGTAETEPAADTPATEAAPDDKSAEPK